MGSCWIDPTVVNSYPTSQPAIPPPQPGQIAPIAEFPAKKWGADFESFIGLADFGHTNWKSIQLRPPPPAESPIVQYEITYLVQASLQRAARLPEILAQDQNFQQYLVGLLMISPRLRLGEQLFDGIQVGPIGQQEQQSCTRVLDSRAHGGFFVLGQVVHDDRITLFQGRYQASVQHTGYQVHAWCKSCHGPRRTPGGCRT